MSQTKTFNLRNLTIRDFNNILDLQNECVDHLPDARLYYPLTAEELQESLRKDIVIGAFDDDELVAVGVIVVNRESPRNLAAETGCPSDHTYTFDAVMVSPRWRGHGLQNSLLRQCIEMAEKADITSIVATVSPDNHHSLHNFTELGFEILSTSKKYDGLVRHIIRYSVNNIHPSPTMI